MELVRTYKTSLQIGSTPVVIEIRRNVKLPDGTDEITAHLVIAQQNFHLTEQEVDDLKEITEEMVNNMTGTDQQPPVAGLQSAGQVWYLLRSEENTLVLAVDSKGPCFSNVQQRYPMAYDQLATFATTLATLVSGVRSSPKPF